MLQALAQEAQTTQEMRGLFAVLVLVMGWGGWRTFGALRKPLFEPIFDRMWMHSFARNRTLVEQELRKEVFQDDLAATTELQSTIARTSEQLVALTLAHEKTQAAFSTSADKMAAAADRMDSTVAGIRGDFEYVSGQVDLLVRQSGASS
jgi:hypothetical protein